MPYINADDLKPLLGFQEDQVVWGQQTFPPVAVVEKIIAGNDRTIDGKCRGRYSVPFDPVPDDIHKISVALTLADLLPAIHRNSPEQISRAKELRREATAMLDDIRLGTHSLLDNDDASHSSTGGPVIVSTPATPRIFSVTDEH